LLKQSAMVVKLYSRQHNLTAIKKHFVNVVKAPSQTRIFTKNNANFSGHRLYFIVRFHNTQKYSPRITLFLAYIDYFLW